MRHLMVCIAAVLMLCRFGTVQAVMSVPSATGYVTDRVGIVEPSEFAKIQVLLGRYEVTSGRRISVLLVASTPDESLEAFADRVLTEWGLDRADKGGALLLWSGEGYVLIRPSRTLADRLDDETQSQILSRWVVPAFARGEAGAGLRQGVEQMIAVLDGGSVAEVPPEAAAAAQAAAPVDVSDLDAAEEAAALDESTEAPPTTESAVSYDALPVWVERLPEDLGRLAAPFAHDVDAGVKGWFREARRDAEQLPVQASGLFLQMRGEQVEPPFPGLSVFAVYAWAVSLGVALLILLPRRAFAPALFVAAVDTGFFLWLATGFVALAGLMVLIGLLAPLLVPLLRSILRGSDDSERDQPAPMVWPDSKAPSRSGVSTAAVARPTRAQRNPVRSAQARPARAAAPVAMPSSGPRRREFDVLLDRLGRIAVVQGRRLRAFHLGVLVVLCLISLPLAVMVVMGVIAITAYRSGAAYLLADMLIRDPQAREHIKRQLPRPSPDVIPDA